MDWEAIGAFFYALPIYVDFSGSWPPPTLERVGFPGGHS